MKKTEYQKQWIRANRDRVNAAARARYSTDGRWEKQLRDRYGITAEIYWRMYNEQSGVCKICGNQQNVGIKLDVDHDHGTGKVRGLLCRHCNIALGLLKDDKSLVLKVLNYLVDSSTSSGVPLL